MYLFLFIVGSCIGSFFNVVVDRTIHNESFIIGRSHCDHCKRQLHFHEMIPVFSYLFLKGKSRCCQEKLSLKHVIYEMIFGMIFVFSYMRFGLNVHMCLIDLIVSILIVIGRIDYYTYDIYVWTLIAFGVLALIYRISLGFDISRVVVSVCGISMIMVLLNVLIPGSFGIGDIELVSLSGLMLGWLYQLEAFVIAVIVAGMYVVFLICLKKTHRHQHIPFAPFLSCGMIITLFYGSHLMIWYLSL